MKHTEEKPNQCYLCDKVFINKSGFICYMKTHTDKELSQCIQCYKYISESRAYNPLEYTM